MANDTKTNSAGDMSITIGGHGQRAHMGCGCHGHCHCGAHSHGHGHGSGGRTHIIKKTTNTIYGDTVEADDSCETDCTGSDDVSLASGVVNDSNELVMTLTNGQTIVIDVSGLVGSGGSGSTGPAGDSAYDLWLAAGNTGTVADFLASLIGPKGDQGDPGSGTGGTTVGAETANPLTGDGTVGNELTINVDAFATWLAANGNEAACGAILACVAGARVIPAGVELDAVDGNTLVLVIDAAGNPAYVPASSIGGGSSSAALTTPFTTGQNPADWSFKGGNIGVLPAGPSGVNGYWNIESDFNDGTLTVGTVSSATNDDNFVGEAGATVSFVAAIGGSYDGLRGHWIATA